MTTYVFLLDMPPILYLVFFGYITLEHLEILCFCAYAHQLFYTFGEEYNMPNR